MKKVLVFVKSPIRVMRVSKRRGVSRFKRTMLLLKAALAQEKQETREMLSIYKRYTKGQASKAEMRVANQQLGDVLKGLGIGIVAILPFAPITIPVMIKLGQWVGVDILPSSFASKDPTAKQIPPTIDKE